MLPVRVEAGHVAAVHVEAKAQAEFSWWRWAALLGLLQCLVWVVLDLRDAVNVPYEDDFYAVLRFLEHYITLHGVAAHLGWVLTAQHNEYKLMLLNSVVALEYSLTGAVNFRTLSLWGDLAPLLVVAMLWCFTARSGRSSTERLLLWTVATLLFLSPRYWRIANWSMSGLQNLSVFVFAVAAFLFLDRRGRWASTATAVCIVLAYATSGNGLLVGVICCGMLLYQRRFAAVGLAAIGTATMFVLYHVHYRQMEVAPALSLLRTVRYVLLMPCTLLGGGLVANPIVAFLLGCCLLALFLWLTFKGWYRADPAPFAAAAFCVLTSLGVATIRYRLGWQAGTTDRYQIYSLLLMAMLALGMAKLCWSREDESEPTPEPVRRASWLASSVRRPQALTWLLVFAALLCAKSDRFGWRESAQRHRLVLLHLAEWERQPAQLDLVPDEAESMRTPNMTEFRRQAQAEAALAVQEGLWVPPPVPAAPAPPSR